MTRVSDRVFVLDGEDTHGPEVVGGKGASIARMLSLRLTVPPAFVLPIEECRRYRAAGGSLDDGAWEAVLSGIAGLERATGKGFGDPAAPLLVSVRSAAAVSMPGMMDTILNLGMTDAVEAGLAALSGDASFARTTHVRFIQEFGQTVLGAQTDPPGPTARADELRLAVLEDTGAAVPTEPTEQLRRGDQRGLRILVLPPRGRLPPALGHRRRRRHRRRGPGDGVRQPRGAIRHGGALHARSAERRAGALRRVARRWSG